MTNKKIFIYYLSVFLFLILTICPLLISFCIKKDYVESRTLYVIDSWIEVKSYVKYDSNWKIISNENNRFFYIKAKDEKNKIFILNYQPRDFYFLVKKTSFVYCENKNIGIFEFYFIRNLYFRLFYICLLIISFVWLVYLTIKLERIFYEK